MRQWFVLGCFGMIACAREPSPPLPCPDAASELPAKSIPGELTFAFGAEVRKVPIDELIREGASEKIETDDPYYGKRKRYRALPLVPLLEVGFGKSKEVLKTWHFTLEAKDGFRTPIEGERLVAPEVYVAFEDLDAGAWQPIGPRGADPGPLYVSWVGEGRSDTDRYPRPWALERITATMGESSLARAIPPGGFDGHPEAREGFSIMERRCLHCHSVNLVGARLGPDLNVPRNVLSYRSETDVRAFIKNPESFRYSSMLPNPDLTERDLDAIVAYLRLIAKHPILREESER